MLLPPFQDDLHAGETNGEEPYADPVNAGHAALQIRWVFHKSTHHQHADDTKRDIDVKNPGPAVVVGQPTPQDRTHGRGEYDAHAKDRHGHTLFLRRIGFAHNSLGDGHQTTPTDALDDAIDDHLRKSLGRPGQYRPEG